MSQKKSSKKLMAKGALMGTLGLLGAASLQADQVEPLGSAQEVREQLMEEGEALSEEFQAVLTQETCPIGGCGGQGGQRRPPQKGGGNRMYRYPVGANAQQNNGNGQQGNMQQQRNGNGQGNNGMMQQQQRNGNGQQGNNGMMQPQQRNGNGQGNNGMMQQQQRNGNGQQGNNGTMQQQGNGQQMPASQQNRYQWQQSQMKGDEGKCGEGTCGSGDGNGMNGRWGY